MCIVTLKVFLLVNQIKWFGWKIPKISLNKEKKHVCKGKRSMSKKDTVSYIQMIVCFNFFHLQIDCVNLNQTNQTGTSFGSV